MPSFDNTVSIGRPIKEVFAYLVDLEHVPEWNYAIAETRKISGPGRDVGTTYRQIRSIPDHAIETLTVTELDPNRRLTVEGHLGPFDARLTYILEANENGTRLRNVVELQAHRPLKLAAALAKGRVKTAVAANLETLRQLLERHEDSPRPH